MDKALCACQVAIDVQADADVLVDVVAHADTAVDVDVVSLSPAFDVRIEDALLVEFRLREKGAAMGGDVPVSGEVELEVRAYCRASNLEVDVVCEDVAIVVQVVGLGFTKINVADFESPHVLPAVTTADSVADVVLRGQVIDEGMSAACVCVQKETAVAFVARVSESGSGGEGDGQGGELERLHDLISVFESNGQACIPAIGESNGCLRCGRGCTSAAALRVGAVR